MPALQVRDFPDDLYEQLKAYAASQHRSIAQQTIVAVEQMLEAADAQHYWDGHDLHRLERRPRYFDFDTEAKRAVRIEKRKELFAEIDKHGGTHTPGSRGAGCDYRRDDCCREAEGGRSMIVLDCSAAVDMVRETEAGRALRQLMLEGEEVISSQLFLIEVSNAFWKYHKAGLLDEKTVCANIEKAIALVDEFCDLDKTQCCEATKEAMRLRHPVYDMLYFVLARRNAATLFTLDRKLQQLCLDNGVDCVLTDTNF